MVSTISKVVVAIAGGHGTESVNLAHQIKEKILKIVTKCSVKVIDLDSMVIDSKNRKYDYTDYNFPALYEDLTNCVAVGASDDPNIVPDEWEIVLLCGCYALFDDKIRNACQLKVFLDSDADTRLIKLIQLKKVKDSEQLSDILNEYIDKLRVEMSKYIEGTRGFADLIIPCSNEGLGSAVILDGIVKVFEEAKGVDYLHNAAIIKKEKSLLNFEAERIDLQKRRYYDLE